MPIERTKLNGANGRRCEPNLYFMAGTAAEVAVERCGSSRDNNGARGSRDIEGSEANSGIGYSLSGRAKRNVQSRVERRNFLLGERRRLNRSRPYND